MFLQHQIMSAHRSQIRMMSTMMLYFIFAVVNICGFSKLLSNVLCKSCFLFFINIAGNLITRCSLSFIWYTIRFNLMFLFLYHSFTNLHWKSFRYFFYINYSFLQMQFYLLNFLYTPRGWGPGQITRGVLWKGNETVGVIPPDELVSF